jgi:C1A family cysteine protease
MAGVFTVRRMGWLPDYPDTRDFTPQHDEVAPMFKGIQATNGGRKALPPEVDLRQFCSPVEDQGQLGSCTANAGVAMIEYFERRAFGHHIDASRLFLYKTTRQLLNWSGDSGAFLRSTMGALTLFGVPPEEYWPYDVNAFDEDPPSFCFAYAQNYQAIKYLRLDPPGTDKNELLGEIKSHLHAGFPSMFGFSVYRSIDDATDGEIPYPCEDEPVVGGHAVMAVGFDDKKKIKNPNCAKPTTGAFLIRNSWGGSWGESGYGWLPYDYVLASLADDWWTVTKAEWIDTENFGA